MTTTRTVLAALLYAMVCVTPASSAEQEIDFRPGYPDLCAIDVRDWQKWRDGFERKFQPGTESAVAVEFLRSLGKESFHDRPFAAISDKKFSFESGIVYYQSVKCKIVHKNDVIWGFTVVTNNYGKIWTPPTQFDTDLIKSVVVGIAIDPDDFANYGLPFEFPYFGNKGNILVALREVYDNYKNVEAARKWLNRTAVNVTEKFDDNNIVLNALVGR